MKNSWTNIRNSIAQDIEDGVLEPGGRLPTEPELAEHYAAGRHSVRRAVAELAKDGHVSIEQGRGTFVIPRPRIEYRIGSRTRLRDNMAAQGIDVMGESLGAGSIRADGDVKAALRIRKGAKVLVTRRLTRADGVPVSFGALYHSAKRFPDFAERRAVMGSVSATYRSYGIKDYLRGETTVYARQSSEDETRQLRQHRDVPVMVVRATDTLLDGTPIAYSEVIWSAARVRFSFGSEGN